MTLSELESLDREYITPAEAAPFLGVGPYSINMQFERDKTALGFPALRIGRSVRIPRRPFIAFIYGKEAAE